MHQALVLLDGGLEDVQVGHVVKIDRGGFGVVGVVPHAEHLKTGLPGFRVVSDQDAIEVRPLPSVPGWVRQSLPL